MCVDLKEQSVTRGLHARSQVGLPLGHKSQRAPQELLGCGWQRVNNGTQLTMLLQAERGGVWGELPENGPVPVK